MKNKLKLLLLSMMFIGLGLSFCNGDSLYDYILNSGSTSIVYDVSNGSAWEPLLSFPKGLPNGSLSGNYFCVFTTGNFVNDITPATPTSYPSITFRQSRYSAYQGTFYLDMVYPYRFLCFELHPTGLYFTIDAKFDPGNGYNGLITLNYFMLGDIFNLTYPSECSSSSIDVLYNNESSTTNITCNGDNVIQIDGLSTITATNKFTPYFNIDYRDEDNQSLVESYSKDILYIKNGLFKKTYTGNNERILTNQSECSSEPSFSGYVPDFEFTGGIPDVSESGNVFNNFAQNSFQVLLSNIPSYIQYVIIIMLLFFILGLARRKKRR